MVKKLTPLTSIPTLVFNETLFISKRSLLIFRIICFCVYVVTVIYNARIDGFLDCCKYLTFWGLHFTGIYTALAIIGYFKRLSNNWKRIADLLFEFAFAYEFVITGFFWIFIYPGLKSKYEENQFEWYSTLILHGFCLFQVYYEFLFNTILIKAKDFGYVFASGIAYLTLNYLYTVNFTPIYAILTYEDSTTMIYLGLAICGILAHFFYGVGMGKLVKEKYICDLEMKMMKTLKF